MTCHIWQEVKFWKWKNIWMEAWPDSKHKNQLVLVKTQLYFKKTVFTDSFRSLWSVLLISYCWLTAIKLGNIVEIERPWQTIRCWQISLFTMVNLALGARNEVSWNTTKRKISCALIWKLQKMERGIWNNYADNTMLLVMAGKAITKTSSWKQKQGI